MESREARDDIEDDVASLRDVASSAGVSASTASRVLSGSNHPVSESTRQRVIAAANQLGFEPNRVARALATARSRTIGVVVHDVSDPYFAEIVRGLEDVAGAQDHALFVSSSDRDTDKELALVRTFVANRVDAIVFAASAIDDPVYFDRIEPVLSRFERLGGIVAALSEHPYPAIGGTYENGRGMTDVTNHLIDLGHQRIAHLSGPPGLIVSTARRDGYRLALAARGIAHESTLEEGGSFSMEGGARAMAALMARTRPTAVAAGNDLMAIGAMRWLVDNGWSVPGDVSVAGFDDIEFAAYASVPLTTMRVPLAELGRWGATVVLDGLAGREPQTSFAVPMELIERASTAPPA